MVNVKESQTSFTIYRLPFTIPLMSFYSKEVNERFCIPQNAGSLDKANARGKGVSFLCGVSVEISLRIDKETREILDAKFKTNGCGFAIATADFLAEEIVNQKLTSLHGLDDLETLHKKEFGEFPDRRRQCADICFEALYEAFAKYRAKQINEWNGERSLICSCFGVDEENIERTIADKNLETVEEIGKICNAGTGCGSCQPLIQEILDNRIFDAGSLKSD